jgi:hypothetical protein
MNIAVQSWQDLQTAMPIDPRSVILNTLLGINAGFFTRSTNLLQSSWLASTLVYSGITTSLVSLDSTDATTIAYAAQWNATHQMVNTGGNIPPSLSKVVFMKAGPNWDNQIGIAFGANTYNNVQLTMRDNLATSGQFLNGSVGSIPAYSFGSGITGNQVLHVTVAQPGVYSVVLGMLFSGNWSTFEMEWIVLP